MTQAPQDSLVSTDWLADHLQAPDVRVVDATLSLPNEDWDARARFEEAHIPGAVFFDIDEIADSTSDLPHMLPPAEKFSSRVRRLGLGDGTRIVVYDQQGLRSAARVWWSFRVFGHGDVAVLDGGLPKWRAEGRALEDGPARPVERHFSARMNTLMVRDRDQVLANIGSKREQMLDARSRGRFQGTETEIWPGRRGGHVPGSLNLPFNELLTEDGTLESPDALRGRFEAAGIDMTRPVITTCGSGITAAVLALGLHLAGHKEVAVYDGSWADWGRPGDTPVEVGPGSAR